MSQNLSVAREEKPLRHVAMIAKILDENKPKKSRYEMNSLLFKLHRSYSIPLN